MKKKSLLLTAAATLGLTAATMAQNVPNYVPTNGLVGWWPFNGNANDESGNGNNGTVNGAILNTDRFGNLNKAYSFDGNSLISVNSTQSLSLQNQFTISLWVIRNNPNLMGFISKQRAPQGLGSYHISGDASITGVGINNDPGGCAGCNIGSVGPSVTYNLWHNYIGLWDGIRLKFYDNGNLIQDVNGVLDNGNTLLNANLPLEFGRFFTSDYLDGKLDDIGIWNRALTQQEITDLYNGNICYQTITVTDTLLINMGITGFNPVTYNNTIKIFPNPTNDHITINYGNFASLNGYQIKIENSLGQQVFQTNITQQSDYLNLTTWGGNGLYFVRIIDPQQNTIDIRKIVLQ
jgi:hypothetical protein